MSSVEAIQSEMQAHVKRLAFPGEPGESVKACIRRVAHRTGLSFGQVRRAWYREWKVFPAHIADTIRQAAVQHDQRLDEKIRLLRERQTRLATLIDSDLHRRSLAEPR